MDNAEKVRENKARRAAERQRLALQKHRARDPRAAGYGTWQLVDAAGELVAGDPQYGYGLTLAEVEELLDRPADRRAQAVEQR